MAAKETIQYMDILNMAILVFCNSLTKTAKRSVKIFKPVFHVWVHLGIT